ncbi:MAG: Lrp/AsnC ligand binding domain-containing protein [Actinomycetota bacterium]|jgi:DNA-binding Lrp family transcriptional regulator
MIEAYVLIQVEIGLSSAVSGDVARATGVEWADDVAGPYDIIARVKAAGLDELARIVVTEIQACTGVTRTLVCVVPGSEDTT